MSPWAWPCKRPPSLRARKTFLCARKTLHVMTFFCSTAQYLNSPVPQQDLQRTYTCANTAQLHLIVHNSDFTQRLWLRGPLNSWAPGPGPGRPVRKSIPEHRVDLFDHDVPLLLN